MSINLTLIFDKHQFSTVVAYDRLGFQFQDYDLFDKIKSITVPTHSPVMWYSDGGIYTTSHDSYGNVLTCLLAGQLAILLNNHVSIQNAWDQAIVEFVKSLPYDSRIILWWH